MATDSLAELDSRWSLPSTALIGGGNEGSISALLVAESDPKDKEVFIRLVMNMLAGAGGV
jgi:hypothetical protein